MVDFQLEILECAVVSIDVIDRQRNMLVLIGKSILFLARLASPARRASEIGWLSDFFLSCRFVRNSLINLFLSKLKLNSVGLITISRDHINTHDKVSRKSAKIEFAKGCKQMRDL